MRNKIPARIWNILRWLRPGLGIKRWFIFVLIGTTILGLGIGVILIDIYHNEVTDSPLRLLLAFVSLNFIPRVLRALIFGGVGIGFVIYGMLGLNQYLLSPFIRSGSELLDHLKSFQRRDRGPHIVAIGGGHGLATLLRGLKNYTRNLTAVVTVADDGGSSGKLRASQGILPPGDIRNCLAALSNDEALLTQLFQYRFSRSPELEGHSFGNLFIAAMADITGSFEDAVAESGRVLSVNGRVLPSTLHNVKLVATMEVPDSVNEVLVEGESKIPKMSGKVHRVWLEPDDAPAFPPVIKAILSADIIIVGPGSLYTSLIPNLLVRDLLAAIRTSRATKIYVCNIATQLGETDFFTCYDHVHALEKHVGKNLFDIILCNDNYNHDIGSSSQWVLADAKAIFDSRTICLNLVDSSHPWRHDSDRLAQVIMDIFFEKTLPLGKNKS